MHKSVIFIALAHIALGQTRPLELKDYFKIESVSAPAISPDGHKVAYVRTHMVEADNKRQSEIWVAPHDSITGAVRVSDPNVNATNPRWSSDGKLLAYEAEPSGGALWFVRMDGGDAKPYHISGIEGMPVFSPDGKWVAYTKKVAPAKDDSVQLSEFDKLTQRRFKGRMYDWMNFRYDGRGYLPDPRDPLATPPFELFIVAAAGGVPRQLTHLGVNVLTPAWREDSQALTFTADLHQRDEYAYERADVWTVTLAAETKMLTKDDGWHHQAPAWSPDGRYIAVLREEGLARVIASKRQQGSATDVVLIDTREANSGIEPRDLTSDWDDIPGPPHWSADGKSIYFESGVKGTGQLFRVNVQAGKVEQVTQGDRVVSQISMAADRIAYISSTTQRTADVYTAAISGIGERRVTAVNDPLLAEWQLGKVQRISFDSKDGTSIDGWVVLPLGYEQHPIQFPLILTIHGGPHGAAASSFSFEEQLLAAAGYIVLSTNPRGSTGYGEKFEWGTWGG